MRKLIANVLGVTALLLVPFAAFGGDFGCCQNGPSCTNDAIFMICVLGGGEFVGDGVCSSTPFGVCGPPPTATPTPSPAPNGNSCTTASQCASMFCVTGVCCDTACDGPNDRCDVSEREGLCTSLAPAPATSAGTLALMGMVLIAIAALGFRQLTG